MNSSRGITADQPFLILDVEVGTPSIVGPVGAGSRRFIPIVGGTVTGAIQGVVIPGGDWQTVHDDGNLEIEAHYGLRTSDGSVVEILSTGVRAAAPTVLQRLQAGEAVTAQEYYFRTAIRFRTGSPTLSYLNFRLAVSRGERRANSVHLEVFEVL